MHISTAYAFDKSEVIYPLIEWLIDVKVSPKERRPHIRCVTASSDGRIHRTSGAVAKTMDLELDPGFYLPVKNGGKIILKLDAKIDAENKAPAFDEWYAVGESHKEVPIFGDNWMESFAALISATGAAFNPYLFERICRGFSGHIKFAGKEDPVVFIGDDDSRRFARIAPMLSF
jgi:hypothetical protein